MSGVRHAEEVRECRRRRLTRRTLLGAACVVASAVTARRQPAAAQGTDATLTGATRSIDHALGTTVVARDPQRVVALGSAVEVALTVGITPIAVDERSAKKAYLADRLAGVPSVGPAWEPNLEQIATLDPDLILGLDVNIEEVYDELSAIAPTIGVDFVWPSDEWKRYNRGFAEALGRVEAFDRAMADYEAKAARFRQAMGDRLAETEVAILRATPENFRFDLRGISIGTVVYGDAGLSLPPRLAAYDAAHPEDGIAEISREQVVMAEGSDAIFVWSVSGDPEADRRAVEAILADPLLGRLEAAREGRVYAVGDHWFSDSVLGAGLVLDDLERYLLENGATPEAGA